MNAMDPASNSSQDFAEPTNKSKTPAASCWQKTLDAFALILASSCAIHCLLLPLIVVIFPLLDSSFVTDPRFHFWMLAAVIPTTAIAVFLGCRKHKDKVVISLSSIGLLLIIIGVAIEMQISHSGAEASHDEGLHSHSHTHQAAPLIGPLNLISILGGILMAASHIRNFRNCNWQNSNCHCTH